MKAEDSKSRRKVGVKPWDYLKALDSMAGLCAKSEQCEADLRLKMRRHALSESDADRVVDYLIEHKFLDDERFARAYARDKIRFNGWGRQKVRLMLRTKKMPGYAIDAALESIDPNVYRDVLARLVKSAARSLQLDVYDDRMKLLKKLYARGFEVSLIREAIADCQK